MLELAVEAGLNQKVANKHFYNVRAPSGRPRSNKALNNIFSIGQYLDSAHRDAVDDAMSEYP